MSIEKENTSTETTPAKSGGMDKFIVIGIIILLIVIVAGLFFTPLGASLLGHSEPAKAGAKKEQATPELDITKVAFTTLPEILLNLRNANGKSSFLKVTFIVQSPTEEVNKKVEKLKPIIVDQFQEYLRGLDVEDLSGSAGLQRVRNELLIRANNILAPDKASDILIGPFLIQ